MKFVVRVNYIFLSFHDRGYLQPMRKFNGTQISTPRSILNSMYPPKPNSLIINRGRGAQLLTINRFSLESTLSLTYIHEGLVRCCTWDLVASSKCSSVVVNWSWYGTHFILLFHVYIFDNSGGKSSFNFVAPHTHYPCSPTPRWLQTEWNSYLTMNVSSVSVMMTIFVCWWSLLLAPDYFYFFVLASRTVYPSTVRNQFDVSIAI